MKEFYQGLTDINFSEYLISNTKGKELILVLEKMKSGDQVENLQIGKLGKKQKWNK